MGTNGNGNNGESNNYMQPSIPRLDGHYEHWSLLMENFLRSKEYWYLIEKGIEEPESGTTVTEAQRKKIEEYKLKDLKAKNYLFQAIDRSTLETISDKDTAKAIWESLKKKYQGNHRVKRATLQGLRKEFEVMEMKFGETINDYIPKVMQIANKMRIHGEKMEDGVIVEKILRSLTERYCHIVCSISESNDTDKMTVDEVHSSLIVHEQNITRFQKVKDEEQALKTETQGRGSGNYNQRGRGTPRGRGRGRGRQNLATVECYKCKKLGHYRNECPEWEKEANCAEIEGDDSMLLMEVECEDSECLTDNSKELMTVEDTDKEFLAMKPDIDESLILMAITQIEEREKRKKDTWYLDSGCSNHMSGNKIWFSELDESFKKSVRLGNDARLKVEGKVA